MGHTITYKHEDQAASDKAAIEDIKFYVGGAKFVELHAMLKDLYLQETYTMDRFKMLLFLFPVSGYPLEAWYRLIVQESSALVTTS